MKIDSIYILTAYIINPSHGKGLSSSNSSVLYLRASSMMHCDLHFKYHNFSLLVPRGRFNGVRSSHGKVSSLPPPLVAVDALSYILHAFALAVVGILP